jgi:hypothetical protein
MSAVPAAADAARAPGAAEAVAPAAAAGQVPAGQLVMEVGVATCLIA